MRLALLGVLAFAVVAAASASGALQKRGPHHQTATRTLAVFSEPSFVSFTLEGCRNDGTITLPIAGQFICPDAAYTTGNLGKGWNELDLVPHRLTTSSGNQAGATTDYNVTIAADYQTNGRTGYDVISVPVVNAAKSDSSCSVSAGPQSTQGSASSPFGGGTDVVIYRDLTVHQDKNTTCVFDYYQRLALGAHLYPGSSLQSYMFNQAGLSGSKKTISIPVNEILPQELSKTMTATQNQSSTWDVTKQPTPATVNIPNTCTANASDRQASVSVQVSWHKLSTDPSGPITVITHVYATNPAARIITVNVSDDIRSGTTVLDTATAGPIDVPANTADYLVLTHQTTVPSGTTDLNDIATASYTDKVTGVAVPGTTTATASANVQASGTTLNSTATVTDVESITGTGWTFSTDSFTPSNGAFGGGYVAGTAGVGPVSWTSNSQTGDGSTTFAKTVYVAAGASSNGTLDDTATLTGSDGFTTSATGQVTLSAHRLADLTINKTIPNILGAGESVTFNFTVTDHTGATVATASIAFGAGDTAKSVKVSGLLPDTYTVTENAPSGTTSTGWTLAPPANVDLTSVCANSVDMANRFVQANASATKITDPTGYESGWSFTMTGPNGFSVTGVTTASGQVHWAPNSDTTVSLGAEGTYTISEQSQTGWAEVGAVASGPGATGGTGAGASCSFTVNYPANANASYGCTITNRSRGHVRVVKAINGAPITGSQDFTFELRLGDQHTVSTSALETKHAASTNGGTINFATDLVPGQTYAICELLVVTYNPTISGYGPYNPLDQANYWCWNFVITVAQAASNPSLIFNVENDHPTSKALTIGYWKNWSACKNSKGKQADVLGQYLNGIKLGTYTFTASLSDECKAVQTLSKNTFTGINKSSDPLFNMAAQLLAAYLNINAQAGVCSSLVTAINGASALLNAYAWNGNSYTGTLSATDAAAANAYAQTLDQYNNNNLC